MLKVHLYYKSNLCICQHNKTIMWHFFVNPIRDTAYRRLRRRDAARPPCAKRPAGCAPHGRPAVHSPDNPHTTRGLRPENARTTKKAASRRTCAAASVDFRGERSRRPACGRRERGEKAGISRGWMPFRAAARKRTGSRGFVMNSRLLRFHGSAGISRG